MKSLAWWLIVALPLCIALLLPIAWGERGISEWLAHPAHLARQGDMDSGVLPSALLQKAHLLQLCWPLAAALLVALPLVWSGLLRRDQRDNRTEPWGVSRLELLIVTTVVVAAATLRLQRLGESLWFDEIASFLDFGIHGPGVIAGNYISQSNHPLYSLLSWLATSVLGANELTLRLPALVMGMALVPASWFLCGELGAKAPGRLAAAVVAACMPIAVLESTDARGYTAMALFGCLAIACTVRLMRGGSPLVGSLAVLFLALGVTSHFVSACVGVGMCVSGLALVLSRKLAAEDSARAIPPLVVQPRAMPLIVVPLLAAALSALLLAPMIPDIISQRSEFLALDGNEPTLLGPEGLHVLLGLGGTWVWWAAIPGLLTLILSIVAVFRRQSSSSILPPLPMLLLLLGGGLTAIVGTELAGSWLYSRFLCFLIGPIAALLGLLADGWWINRREQTLFCAALLSLCWIGSLMTLPPRQQIREAVAFVADEADSGLAVGLRADVHLWYASMAGIEMPGTGPLGVNLKARLPQSDARHVLVLYPRTTLPLVQETLEQHNFSLAARFPGWMDWNGGEILVYRKNAAAPPR